MIVKNFTFLILLNSFTNYSFTLDLSKLEELGIQGGFYVSDIAVYFNRAFLAIPRGVCENNITSPTLVEVPWKDFNTILKIRSNKPIEGQIWAKCDDLQNAISLAKEGVKSKLWILDKGNKFCPAKIVAYNMLQNTFLADETIGLGEISKSGLNSMVIENSTRLGNHRLKMQMLTGLISLHLITVGDTYQPKRRVSLKTIDNGSPNKRVYQFWVFLLLMVTSWIGQAIVVSIGDAICFEMLAFIANAESNTILVCYLNNHNCDHLNLQEPKNPLMPINVDFLALSETGSEMYLTGTESTEVFSLDLVYVPEETDFKNLTVNVTYLGEKLGPSTGLDADLKDGLLYYLTRDYAVVRWMIGKPLQAEYHDVLAQSFKRLPYVSRIFTGPQGSVYALVNPFNPIDCKREEDYNNNVTDDGDLERVVKILKYNLFDKLF